jgi:hypothetical protein
MYSYKTNCIPQQVAAQVDVIVIHKLAARVQLRVVVQQLDLARLQHVVQPQLVTGRQLVK